ncbi:MAG: DoxX-like family protein [Thiobacillus sp.]|nr:DoxX-like family protein [Thiobacillus sp.]
MDKSDQRAARLSLAVVWLVTGALSLGVYPKADSLLLLEHVGLHAETALIALYLAATMDIVLGLLTLLVPRKGLWLFQATLIVVYTLIISIWLPEFWLHPFGPVLKNIPILVLLGLLHKYEGKPS